MTGERINPGYLQPGTMVGAYRIVDLVGHGGFGFLYRVERDGKTYALKLSRERLSDLTAEDRVHNEERLDREILALKSLRHANIVRVHCFERWPGLEDGFPYLVMDFVAGERLYDWRAHTVPSLRRICEVLVKIALAVDYMHGLGLFHRDLKSENILVRSADGEPILVDFGIARPKASYTVTRAQNTLGTITHYAPEYAAWTGSAEFFKGEAFDWKATTDLHSLGYVAYELLTGKSPFPRAESENEQLHLIMTVVPTLPSVRSGHRVPESLDKIVMRLLEKNPEARFQRGRELADALRSALDEAGPDWDAPFDIPASQEGAAATAGPPSPRVAAAPTRVADPSAAEAPGAFLDAAADDGSRPPSAIKPLPLITDERAVTPRPSTPASPADPPPGVPVAKGGFNPPTNIRPALTGIGPAPRAAEEEEAPRPAPILPTAIRRQAESLGGPAKRKPNVILLVGGGLAAVVVLLFVAAAIAGEKSEPRRTDLLADVERQRQQEAAGKPEEAPPPPPPVATPLNTASPILAAQDASAKAKADSQAEPEAEPPPPPPPAAASGQRAPRRDASDIDAELARQYGRPTVAPETADEAGAPPPARNDPPWLRRSKRLDTSTKVAAAATTRGVPLGAHLRAKLLSNLDSRTIGGAPVEAMLVVPYIVNGNVILPARTMVYGRGSATGGRFTIAFTRMRLPDHAEVGFDGIALDDTDRKAGLVAARRLEPTSSEGPGVGAQVAKGTANTLLGTVRGGLGQDIVRDAGREVVNGQGTVGPSSGSSAILLDAPVNFEIFVNHAF